jgi:hypothetical protein
VSEINREVTVLIKYLGNGGVSGEFHPGELVRKRQA